MHGSFTKVNTRGFALVALFCKLFRILHLECIAELGDTRDDSVTKLIGTRKDSDRLHWKSNQPAAQQVKQ